MNLRALADERLGDDGEALRVIYGPTFHANVAITLRRVGELGELEVLVEDVAPERAMLTAEECAPPFALLRRPIDAWDEYSRDGISAHGERWDGREQVIADIGNPRPADQQEARRLLREVLEFAAARPWSGPVSKALVDVRGYLDEDEQAPPLRLGRCR